jgi:hypothetical protein
MPIVARCLSSIPTPGSCAIGTRLLGATRRKPIDSSRAVARSQTTRPARASPWSAGTLAASSAGSGSSTGTTTNRSANLGYVFAEHAWGQGYATEAGRALLEWGFAVMDLNRVSAQTDTRNEASARVLTKLGFTLEGILRENVIVDGEVSDDATYSLLRREWTSTHSAPSPQ